MQHNEDYTANPGSQASESTRTASMGYFPNDALKLKHKHLQDKTVRREEMRTTEINGRTPWYWLKPQSCVSKHPNYQSTVDSLAPEKRFLLLNTALLLKRHQSINHCGSALTSSDNVFSHRLKHSGLPAQVQNNTWE